MTLRLALSDHGSTFATRGRASELREAITSELGTGGPVEIDFAGVTNVTYSFADELIGKLAASGIKVQPFNMAPAIEVTVRRAVERRSAPVSVS